MELLESKVRIAVWWMRKLPSARDAPTARDLH